MDYSDSRIDLEQIEQAEIDKIFPIFRFRKIAMIFMLVVLIAPILYSLLVSILGLAFLPGTASSVMFGVVLVFSIIRIVVFLFLYKQYENGNMTTVWVAFAVLVIVSLLSKSWTTLLFYAWLATSIYLTNKAREEAKRIYTNLKEAQRYSQERESRKTINDSASYQTADTFNGRATPIDNSNIFAKQEDVNLVSMDSIFKKPGSAATDIPKYEVSPAASFNAVEETAQETIAETKTEVKSDVPAPVEGRGGLRFCPKCTFSLLPDELVCPRCN